MRKLALQLGLALAVLASATASHATIFVKISDGTTTLDGTVTLAVGNFTLNKPSLASTDLTIDVTDPMPMFTCSPCTVYFPSGATAPQPGDTFAFSDTNAAGPFARVVKFDSAASADRISLRGVTIKSLTAGKTLTLTYGTKVGDLRTLTTGDAYPATAAMSGTFRTALGSRATACGDGTTSNSVSTPCVKLEIKVNGTTVDGQGTTAIATAAVPCNNSFPAVNPCGTSGSWIPLLGTFSGVNDTNSIACPSPCVPNSRGTLTAVFNGANETLTLAASTHGVVAATSAPKGGLEQNFLSLADELGPNRWVSYSAVNQRCVAVPTGSTITPGNNVNNNSTITVSFEVDCSFLVPLTPPAGLDLLSIVDAAEVKIAGATRTLNDASRVAFLPGQGQLTVKGITVFSLSYDVLVGPGPSGNATLGDVTYSDCSAGSLRVELTLNTSTGAPAGTAKVYLGSNTADHGQSGCNGFESIGTDLVNNPAARVDTSGLAGNLSSSCCITFKQFQTGPTGKLVVQKAVFINDHGSLPLTTFANHRVTFFDGNVNGVTALSSLQVVSPTGFRQVSDLPTSGVSMTVRKLTLNQVPIADPPVVKILLDSCTPTPPATTCDPDIEINGHQYRAHFNINSIQPDSSGGLFSIDLCPFGAEEVDPSVTATTPRGMCIPNQAILTLL